jgi:hypothetical protein
MTTPAPTRLSLCRIVLFKNMTAYDRHDKDQSGPLHPSETISTKRAFLPVHPKEFLTINISLDLLQEHKMLN